MQMVFPSSRLPWIIDITALNRNIGITCGDVIDQLSDFMHEAVGQDEFSALSRDTQHYVGAAYHHHRSPSDVDDIPGESMGAGLLRADFLARNCMFMGLEYDESLLRKRLLPDSKKRYPCTWVVRLGRRMEPSDEERMGRDARAREYGRSLSASRIRGLVADADDYYGEEVRDGVLGEDIGRRSDRGAGV